MPNLYKHLSNNKIQCLICSHFCVIKNKDRGICKVYENVNGQIVNHLDSKIITKSIDPIEKKPLYHFLPQSLSYSIAGCSCNFECSFCQNYEISQSSHAFNYLQKTDPKQIIEDAIKSRCKSISYTYNEPTISIEFFIKIAKEAKKNGLKNIFVTNGYMSDLSLNLIAPYLDAANVDLKAFSEDFYKKYCGAKLEPVKKNLIKLKEKKILFEIATLLIPNLNDDEDELKQMADFIVNKLGEETPWHINRFHPSYKMMDIKSTPIATLVKARKIAKEAGIRHVYLGNVQEEFSNTYCPSCSKLLIRRESFFEVENFLKKDMCPDCGYKINIIY